MIRKPDGSPYSLSCLGLWRPGSEEHKLADKLDREAIRAGGSPVYYYKYYPSRPDELLQEERAKLLSPCPIPLFAVWNPPRPIQELSFWGIDSPDQVTFSFNRTEFFELVGEMPRVGSVILTEFDREQWEIIRADVNLEDDKDTALWSRIRISVLANKYQASATDHDPLGQGMGSNVTTGHGGVQIR